MAYSQQLFEWDDAKSEANLRERGFGFDYAAGIFDDPTFEREDRRKSYGESRMLALGRVNRDVLLVVYTRRGNVTRIISARLANRRERDAYRSVFG